MASRILVRAKRNVSTSRQKEILQAQLLDYARKNVEEQLLRDLANSRIPPTEDVEVPQTQLDGFISVTISLVDSLIAAEVWRER